MAMLHDGVEIECTDGEKSTEGFEEMRVEGCFG